MTIRVLAIWIFDAEPPIPTGVYVMSVADVPEPIGLIL